MNGRVAALLAAAALFASGCGGSDPAAPVLVTTTTSTPVDVEPSDSVTTSTTGASAPAPASIVQVECPAGLDRSDGVALACGEATVSLDRSDGSLGTTTISVATLAGEETSASTPLAVLQGGPGGASTDLGAWFPRQPYTQVFIDQRGTGFAGPDFDCPEFEATIPSLLSVGSDEALPIADGAYDACARRLADDIVLAHTDSDAHGADVVEVMAALGYEEWVVYGVSYGTTIGLEVLRDDPPGLIGAVLDGVYPLGLDTDRGVVETAERALDEVDRACGNSPECTAFLPEDGFRTVLERVMADLDAAPLRVAVSADDLGVVDGPGGDLTVVLDGTRVAEFTFLLMYHESLLRYLPAVIGGLDERDESSAAWLASTGARLLTSSQGANDEGTYFGVQCHDRLPFTDGPGRDLPAFGGAVAAVPLADLCADWGRDPGPASTDDPVRSTIPTLLLSGEFDPITPPEYADEVATGLADVIDVVQGGRGHGIWYGSDCIAGIVQRFVADPLASLDTGCAAEPVPVEWARP